MSAHSVVDVCTLGIRCFWYFTIVVVVILLLKRCGFYCCCCCCRWVLFFFRSFFQRQSLTRASSFVRLLSGARMLSYEFISIITRRAENTTECSDNRRKRTRKKKEEEEETTEYNKREQQPREQREERIVNRSLPLLPLLNIHQTLVDSKQWFASNPIQTTQTIVKTTEFFSKKKSQLKFQISIQNKK